MIVFICVFLKFVSAVQHVGYDFALQFGVVDEVLAIGNVVDVDHCGTPFCREE